MWHCFSAGEIFKYIVYMAMALVMALWVVWYKSGDHLVGGISG